jgi:predicted nucleic acid-binding protein
MLPGIVIDTNVLIAGLHSPHGASYQILQRIGTGAFTFSLSVPLVLEYEAVAKEHARELGLTYEDVDDVIDYLCQEGEARRIFYLWRPILKDPRDDMVLELAVEAGVDGIVTHNVRDFAEAERFGIRILRPGALLRQLESEP